MDFGKGSSRCRRLRARRSPSKNAEGPEAFWTQAKPEPAGRARRAGRANQTLEPFEEAGQQAWEAPQLPLNDGRVLILDPEPLPDDGLPVYQAGGAARPNPLSTALQIDRAMRRRSRVPGPEKSAQKCAKRLEISLDRSAGSS